MPVEDVIPDVQRVPWQVGRRVSQAVELVPEDTPLPAEVPGELESFWLLGLADVDQERMSTTPQCSAKGVLATCYIGCASLGFYRGSVLFLTVWHAMPCHEVTQIRQQTPLHPMCMCTPLMSALLSVEDLFVNGPLES